MYARFMLVTSIYRFVCNIVRYLMKIVTVSCIIIFWHKRLSESLWNLDACNRFVYISSIKLFSIITSKYYVHEIPLLFSSFHRSLQTDNSMNLGK